jgi:putative hemolysin
MLAAEIAVVLLLMLVNGLLAMAELAVVSSRRSRLQSLHQDGRQGAQVVLRLLDDPTTFLSTVQIGITLVGVLAGAFSGATLAERLGEWLDRFSLIAPHGGGVAFALVVIVVTYLSLVIGELVPKRIALTDPERVAAAIAPAMEVLARVASPAVWVLKGATEGLLRSLGLGAARDTTISEDEIRVLITEATMAGVFMPKEREMIEGVLRLADRSVRAIMTPRAEVAWLEEKAGAAEILQMLRDRRLSRFPVCRETLDHPLGIVHMKDIVRAAVAGEPIDLTALMVPPPVVIEGTPVLRLLESFRTEGVHMAIVVDEYGAVQGVVTPVDVLESVAGELPEQGEAREQTITKRADGSWLVDGSVAIDEFEDRVGARGLRGSNSFNTVAGYALFRFGRLPIVGDAFDDRFGRFEVVDMDGRRIDKILFQPVQEEDG